MIRKELSFAIDTKFGGEATYQNEDPFKGKFERSVAVGETIDEFSFGSNATNMIEEGCHESDGAEGGFGPSDYGAGDGWDSSDPLFLRNYAQFLEGENILDATSMFILPLTNQWLYKLKGDKEALPKSKLQRISGEKKKDDSSFTLVDEYPWHSCRIHRIGNGVKNISKGELFKAEEYYDRAMMADPNNSEVLCLYAKLVWELYRDKEQALTCFERAALAASGDSDILGAYASFLWEIDEEEEGHLSDTQVDDQNGVLWNDTTKDFEEQERPSSPLHLAMGLGLGLDMPSISKVAGMKTESTETTGVEEYYRGMLEKNSCNPLFLKDHTEFLNQSEGDLRGAENYYSRAIRDDSSNGPIMSQYANLVWQLYQDKKRADAYFNQAVEATPRDSDVLASYAKFLWEIEDDFEEEEDSAKSQGDLREDEQYYLGAILKNPRNGQIMSEYASLIWQLHGDKDRAYAYFKQAIQETPEDSDVLASYAKFLWEIDDEEEDSSEEA